MTARTPPDEPQYAVAGNRLSRTAWLAIALAITAVAVIAAAIWASEDPDGLERVAEDLGFVGAGADPGFEVLPDYTLPGLEGVASTIVAGLVGVVVVVGLMLVLGRLLARRRT
ncbi:MAG TPA: PDGLE domain-containing protein [Candidatus Limnocylindrales bacterium]|nr:PDGLE domain-containing protein [Candidatus Limnocylindrales bacterium]